MPWQPKAALSVDTQIRRLGLTEFEVCKGTYGGAHMNGLLAVVQTLCLQSNSIHTSLFKHLRILQQIANLNEQKPFSIKCCCAT